MTLGRETMTVIKDTETIHIGKISKIFTHKAKDVENVGVITMAIAIPVPSWFDEQY